MSVKINKDGEILRLKKEIEKLKKNIKKQRYGLVWVDVPEAFEDDAENKLPILKEVPDLEIKNKDDKPQHILIEGDNYHALTCLNYTHKGKVDVIYIDPPYNTGSDGFKYKDKRILNRFPDGTEVPKDSPYRHSYWLSFMKKRLELARDLLKDDGTLFISIDDNEFAQLRLLCVEVFKSDDLVDVIVWKKSGYGRDGKMKNTTTFRKDHEYLIVCYKKNKILNKILEVPEFQNVYSNPDNDSRGPFKAGSISRKEEASNPHHKNYYKVVSPSGKEFIRQFDVSKEEFDKLDNDKLLNSDGSRVGRIYWGKNNDAVPAIKIFINEERSIVPYSVFLSKGSTTDGTKEVGDILDKDCNDLRPKPTKLVETLIQLSTKRDSFVLDFFAGTGTTGHATIKLNKKDGGNRQFILVTNDENRIFSDYCYPRIKNVIDGYKSKIGKEEELFVSELDWDYLKDNFNILKEEVSKKVEQNKNNYKKIEVFVDGDELKIIGLSKDKETIEGLGNSLKCYKAEFVGKNSILFADDKDKAKLAHNAGELLAIAENTLNQEKNNKYFQIFKAKNEDKYTAVYFREELDKFDDFIGEVLKIKGDVAVYLFSWEDSEKIEEFEDCKNITVKTIPKPILEIYKQIYNLI